MFNLQQEPTVEPTNEPPSPWSPSEINALQIIVIVMSSLSVLGSLMIIVSWCFKGARSPSRKLVVILSVTDLFTALSYLLSAVIHSENFCKAQVYATVFFSSSASLWTAAIAIHLFASAKFKDSASSLVKWYHLICWGYPLVSMLVVVFTDSAGRAISDWCFIPKTKPYWRLLRLQSVYLPLWVSWVLTATFYILTKNVLYKYFKYHVLMKENLKKAFQIDAKLTAIPLIFVLLRIPGSTFRIIDMFYNTDAGMAKYYWLEVGQSFGDPSQGFFNAIFYVVLTKLIRDRYIQFFQLWRIRMARACCGSKEEDPVFVNNTQSGYSTF